MPDCKEGEEWCRDLERCAASCEGERALSSVAPAEPPPPPLALLLLPPLLELAQQRIQRHPARRMCILCVPRPGDAAAAPRLQQPTLWPCHSMIGIRKALAFVALGNTRRAHVCYIHSSSSPT